MIELLAAYLVLGGLTALARGRWRLSELARTTLVWPVMIPELLRGDPAPVDPPRLQAWVSRIGAAVGSLQAAIDQGRLLGNEDAGRKLLTDTRADLLRVARRHAELDALLDEPTYDLRTVRGELATAEDHRRAALSERVARIEQLHRAREGLETRLEEGMAEVMNLAARLHLARATGAPVQSVQDRIRALSDAVGGAVEAERLGGLDLEEILPGTWSPPPTFAEAFPDTDARQALEELLDPPPPELPAVKVSPAAKERRSPPPHEPVIEETWTGRMGLVGTIMALTLGSLFFRLLVMGGLEQTSALFIGLPALLAMIVALLPAGRSFTGIILKVITLMLLLSGVALAEGLICIIMAAPLFYMVGMLAGLVLDLIRSHNRATRLMMLAPLALLSMEGVDPALSLDRAETVTVQRVVAGAPADVAASLGAQPDFGRRLPVLLRLGFPRPVRAFGRGLEVGDRRVVHLAGGEGEPGDLVLEVAESGPGHVRFVARGDDSHVAHWLSWEDAQVDWEAAGPDRTTVTWTLRYDRELDPALWFGPVERAAVALTADYLMDCLLPSEVPDAAR